MAQRTPRLEGSLHRSDIYRTATALIEQFVATYNEAPGSITLDIDHTDDAAHGQQELTFYNHQSHLQNYPTTNERSNRPLAAMRLKETRCGET